MDQNAKASIVARLILSTKRKKRHYSILEVAQDIVKLKSETGELNDVAKTIGISVGMINQFLSVFKLPINVQDLVKVRKIDSVAIVYLLSKLSEEDIQKLTPLILDSELNGQDLKVLIPYRKHHKNENITELVETIKGSKNIKVSVIRSHHEDVIKSKEHLTEIIKGYVGDNNFISADKTNGFFDIKVTKEGERILRQKAKEEGLTLKQFIDFLIG